jgi:hypothetical protein
MTSTDPPPELDAPVTIASASMAAPTTAAAWEQLTTRLGRALSVLEEDNFLILSVKGTGAELGEDGRPGSPRYVQFAGQGTFGLRAEAVSNAYLAGPEQLTEDQERHLERLGWSSPTCAPGTPARDDPDGSSNYYFDFGAPVPFAVVGALATRTLRDVHGAAHPGSLQYTAFTASGECILLPELGLMREPVPVAPDIAEDLAPSSPDELLAAIDLVLAETSSSVARWDALNLRGDVTE